MGGQPWHFLVIRDPARKAQLADLKNRYCPPAKRNYAADFLRAAPVIIVVCVEHERAFSRALENGIVATATLMIAAAALGLGSTYLSAYDLAQPSLASELHKLLVTPAGITPVTIVPLGYPAGEPPEKALRPLREIVHLEHF
jgi:nitroreductase